MRRIRVLVADDHPEVLSALVSVLEEDGRFAVVGTATTEAVVLSAVLILVWDYFLTSVLL